MKQNRPSRHLDPRRALDYLDGLLPAAERREVEEHLGGPCPDCHERLSQLGWLLQRMRRDRTPEVPAWLHERALAAFEPAPRGGETAGLIEALARLVFDSRTSPVPAGARRAVGEARRLRFELDGAGLELEIESEDSGLVTVRGRLEGAEPELAVIEVAAEGERLAARPDSNGVFLLERVPAGVIHVAVVTPAGRFRMPAISP